jgi:hypothetical protein
MWRRIDIVLTDVSEERIASIFKVEEKRKNPQAKNQVEHLFTAPHPRILPSSNVIEFHFLTIGIIEKFP